MNSSRLNFAESSTSEGVVGWLAAALVVTATGWLLFDQGSPFAVVLGLAGLAIASASHFRRGALGLRAVGFGLLAFFVVLAMLVLLRAV